MKKLVALMMLFVMAFGLVACETEIVTLHCDGEGCSNTVEMKVENNSKPDESWVIFCKDCADNVLAD